LQLNDLRVWFCKTLIVSNTTFFTDHPETTKSTTAQNNTSLERENIILYNSPQPKSIEAIANPGVPTHRNEKQNPEKKTDKINKSLDQE